MNPSIEAQFEEMKAVLNRFSTPDNFARIRSAANLMAAGIRSGHKIISCGNGGSMCDAMHFAEELVGRYRGDRPSIPAIAINDPSYISCVANDYSYEEVFSRYVEGVGNAGDVLLAISTSGNSPNVLHAAITARAKNMPVVGLTGNNGGALASICDVEIRVPHNGPADRIQEIHIKVIHSLIYLIECELWQIL